MTYIFKKKCIIFYENMKMHYMQEQAKTVHGIVAAIKTCKLTHS